MKLWTTYNSAIFSEQSEPFVSVDSEGRKYVEPGTCFHRVKSRFWLAALIKVKSVEGSQCVYGVGSLTGEWRAHVDTVYAWYRDRE